MTTCRNSYATRKIFVNLIKPKVCLLKLESKISQFKLLVVLKVILLFLVIPNLIWLHSHTFLQILLRTYFNNFLIYMEDQGLSNSRKYFHTKLKEDMRILYKRFNVFCLLVLIYKVFIKIPGFFSKKNVYDENFKIEKKILS